MKPFPTRPVRARAGLLKRLALVGFGVLGISALLFRVEVEGESMLPTLEPGDRLLVLRLWGGRGVRQGDLVTVPDPRPDSGGRVLVKRVGMLVDGQLELIGDNVEASTDSRSFGLVAPSSLGGRVLYRYRPSDRSGSVH